MPSFLALKGESVMGLSQPCRVRTICAGSGAAGYASTPWAQLFSMPSVPAVSARTTETGC